MFLPGRWISNERLVWHISGSDSSHVTSICATLLLLSPSEFSKVDFAAAGTSNMTAGATEVGENLMLWKK